MSVRSPYVDTSALAKWYLNELGSEEFVAFASRSRRMLISRLTVLEFRCLLGRRRRNGDLSEGLEREILVAFEEDMSFGHLDVLPLRDQHVAVACQLLQALRQHPLRTLDALHLAMARDAGAPAIATADRVMVMAAADLGFEVTTFGASTG
jgi:hypothetical protein